MSSNRIAVPSVTKEILKKYGIHAKKGYGQNFLVDPVITERCALASHCQDAVIEIGPGIGSLTESLALHSKHVTAYEIDPDMVKVLKDTLADYHNVEIVEGDFLKGDFEGKVQQLKKEYGSVSVCSNLPYYITSPILFRIFTQPDIHWITVMVQKEVGERFAAAPGDSNYGAISAEAQCLYHVKKLFDVPGRSFNPSPMVDSVIIQFERKPDLSVNTEKFDEVVLACFHQRRKTIYNNLKEYLQDGDKARSVLEQSGIRANERPQNLSSEQYRSIYEALQ